MGLVYGIFAMAKTQEEIQVSIQFSKRLKSCPGGRNPQLCLMKVTILIQLCLKCNTFIFFKILFTCIISFQSYICLREKEGASETQMLILAYIGPNLLSSALGITKIQSKLIANICWTISIGQLQSHLQGCYYCNYFAQEEMKMQSNWITCLRHSNSKGRETESRCLSAPRGLCCFAEVSTLTFVNQRLSVENTMSLRAEVWGGAWQGGAGSRFLASRTLAYHRASPDCIFGSGRV